jgi:uncharacterized protein
MRRRSAGEDSRRRDILISLLILGALFFLGVSVYGSLEITRIPYLAVPFTPRDMKWPYEEITFLSHDGLRLKGWFVPAPHPSSATLFILHGKGSNAGDMLQQTAALRQGNWNLFYFNFRGHGGSEGTYSSIGPLELKDFESAIAYLKSSHPASCRRIAAFGHSLGAAVALVGAARHPEILGVAAESSFRHVDRTIRRFAWLFYHIPSLSMTLAMLITSFRLGVPIGRFAPVRSIGKIAPRPVLLIQGEQDVRVPMSDAKALFKAAHEPKELWVVPGADHGKPWEVAKEAYETKLTAFFRKVFS